MGLPLAPTQPQTPWGSAMLEACLSQNPSSVLFLVLSALHATFLTASLLLPSLTFVGCLPSTTGVPISLADTGLGRTRIHDPPEGDTCLSSSPWVPPARPGQPEAPSPCPHLEVSYPWDKQVPGDCLQRCPSKVRSGGPTRAETRESGNMESFWAQGFLSSWSVLAARASHSTDISRRSPAHAGAELVFLGSPVVGLVGPVWAPAQ